MRILGILILIGVIRCCNNMCNGHGECLKRDKCECYPGWGGADCSLRNCPYSNSWTDIVLGDLNHDGKITDIEVKTEWYPLYGVNEKNEKIHSYAECSGSGICDNYKGECKCFNGFEGAACQRYTCPSNNDQLICSGHGICENIEYNLNTQLNLYTSWEINKIYSCKCDKGYRGLDCSERKCPYGIDNVISKTPVMNLYYRVKSNCDEYSFNYTYDEVTYTSSIIHTANETELLSDLKIYKDYNYRLNDIVQQIPPLSNCYTKFLVLDDQAVIQCNNLDINLFLKSKIEGECIELFAAVSDRPEQFECGNNGLCNRKTGLCDCYDGFSGLACENMNEIYVSENKEVESSENEISSKMIEELFDL